jgi:16S rRNA C967 or C1407 C5-methylase (RsmB/RsmF family)
VKEPSRYLTKLAAQLFEDQAESARFMEALSRPGSYPGAVLWLSGRPSELPFEIVPALSWQPSFVDRIPANERPGQLPLHQAGAYYCLDFSSVLAASPLLSLKLDRPVVLDLCSAPGGKAIFAARTFHGAELICNEVIRKRTPALISNLKRCAIQNVKVVSRDSSYFAEAHCRQFDLVLVDAPCSGQSLLAKGEKSPGCFHPATVNMNANRQKRILANASKAVKSGGYIAYMTCTYSQAENEEVIAWLLKKMPGFTPCEIPELREFRSLLADFPCYRIWPQSGIGAGAFSALLRFEGDDENATFDSGELPIFWQQGDSMAIGE